MTAANPDIAALGEPTWENCKRSVGNALRYWDRWCPDDGRVRAHFDNIVGHLEPAPDRDNVFWLDVVLSVNGVREAKDMAWRAFKLLPPTNKGKPQVFAPEYIAYCVAAAVHKLSVPVVARSANPEVHYAGAMEFAGWANIAAFVTWPDLLDEEGEQEEEVKSGT